MGRYHNQDDGETTTGGLILGIILTLAVSQGFWHYIESKCQNDNNVADCEWVSSPTEQEGTGQSVIYQR
jgi:hypothetical protein